MGAVNANGKVLRELRLLRGLTQLELAESAGISERTIRSAEKGQRISRSHVTYIADALGVQPAEIAYWGITVGDGSEAIPESLSLLRILGVMFNHHPVHTVEKLLHHDIQLISCGDLPNFYHLPPFSVTCQRVEESMHFLEKISEYFDSIGPINVRVAVPKLSGSVITQEGLGSLASGVRKTEVLRFTSVALFEEGKLRIFLNHFVARGTGDASSRSKPSNGFLPRITHDCFCELGDLLQSGELRVGTSFAELG